MKTKIIRNSAKCHNCNTEIESQHRWDYVSCPCLNISVDGGLDYIRRSAKHIELYEDTSIVVQLPEKEKKP